MTELVIIADDLTGAADSAASLTRLGRTSIVIAPDDDWPDDVVVSLDTDSRHCPPGDAAERVAAATRRAVAAGARIVKKIDSTLRGNVAAELRAVADVLAEQGERALVVTAPAFPATSRTTVDGVVHVGGRRLDAHGSDGDVVGLLGRGGLSARHLGLDALAHPEVLAAAYDESARAGLDAVVVDSVTEEHLETVVEAARLARGPVVLAGSGGLTRPLAATGGQSPARYDGPIGDRQTLVVVGSYAPQSREQLRRLAERGLRHVVLRRDAGATAREVRAALSTGPTVLSPDPAAPVVRSEAASVARLLAEVAAAALPETGTLVATGGETARAVLTHAGVTRLLVLGEVEPGIVRSRVPELDLDVVTKAGAFGDADALFRCLTAA